MAVPNAPATFGLLPESFWGPDNWEMSSWTSPYQTTVYEDSDDMNVQLVWQTESLTSSESEAEGLIFYRIKVRAQVAFKTEAALTQTWFYVNQADLIPELPPSDLQSVCQYTADADPDIVSFVASNDAGDAIPASDTKFSPMFGATIDYSDFASWKDLAGLAFPGLGTYTPANGDGWYLTTCDSVLYTGIDLSLMTEEELALMSDDDKALLQAQKAKFLVGFGGYSDGSSETPDNYLTLPSELFEIDVLYPADDVADDSAMSTAASLLTASVVALALL